jgi:hypothetical protein
MKRSYSIQALFLPKYETCYQEYLNFKKLQEQEPIIFEDYDLLWKELTSFFEYKKLSVDIVASRHSTFSIIISFDRNYHHLTNKRDKYRLNYFATEGKAKERAIEKGITFLDLILRNKVLPFKKRLTRIYTYKETKK